MLRVGGHVGHDGNVVLQRFPAALALALKIIVGYLGRLRAIGGSRGVPPNEPASGSTLPARMALQF
jgi:hypothetical protein